jgi:hypothetical protein
VIVAHEPEGPIFTWGRSQNTDTTLSETVDAYLERGQRLGAEVCPDYEVGAIGVANISISTPRLGVIDCDFICLSQDQASMFPILVANAAVGG